MNLITKLLFCVVAFALSSPLYALDDKRKGFFFEFGAGLSASEFYDESYRQSERWGLSTSLKGGVGFNDRTVGYYVRHLAWSLNIIDSVGFSGVGVAHYFSSSDKSVFLNAALGIGDSLDIDRIYDMGAGYIIGGGYQLSKRNSWEVNYFTFSDDYVSGGDVSAIQFNYKLHWF